MWVRDRAHAKSSRKPCGASAWGRSPHAARSPGGEGGTLGAQSVPPHLGQLPWGWVQGAFLPTFPVLPTGPVLWGPLLSDCSTLASMDRTVELKCPLQGRFVGVRSGVLLLQQSYPLLEHPHLGLMSLHHGHHLRLQLLQFVLMLLLCFLIGSHQVAMWAQREMRMKAYLK